MDEIFDLKKGRKFLRSKFAPFYIFLVELSEKEG